MEATGGARRRRRLRARRRRAVPDGARLAREGRAPRHLRRPTPARSCRSTSSRSSARQLTVIGSFVFDRERGRDVLRARRARRAQAAGRRDVPARAGARGDGADGEPRVLREDRPAATGGDRSMKRDRCRRRRHVHRPDLRRRRGGRRSSSTSSRRRRTTRRGARSQGIRELAEQAGVDAVRARPGLPRHDDRDEHRDRAQRRDGRDDHDRGLPRHPPHRAAQEAAQLLELPGSAVAARIPIVRRRYRLTVPERITATAPCSSRSTRSGRASRCARSRRPGVEAVCRLLPVLVPQPGARAARGRDRARGVPRGVPLGLVGGDPAVPRVRALLDGRPERVRRPEGRDLRRAARGRASRRSACAPGCT